MVRHRKIEELEAKTYYYHAEIEKALAEKAYWESELIRSQHKANLEGALSLSKSPSPLKRSLADLSDLAESPQPKKKAKKVEPSHDLFLQLSTPKGRGVWLFGKASKAVKFEWIKNFIAASSKPFGKVYYKATFAPYGWRKYSGEKNVVFAKDFDFGDKDVSDTLSLFRLATRTKPFRVTAKYPKMCLDWVFMLSESSFSDIKTYCPKLVANNSVSRLERNCQEYQLD